MVLKYILPVIFVFLLYIYGWIYWYFKFYKRKIYARNIISFHKVSKYPEFGGTTNLLFQFENYLKFLKENGFKTTTIDDFLKSKEERKILIFFDDAYENVYRYAFPIMKKYSFTGVLSPVAGYIGKRNVWDAKTGKFKHMDLGMLKEMGDYGFEIISHSFSHKDLRKLNSEKLDLEIFVSKEILEKSLKRKIEYFLYPYGLTNERVKRKVKSAGYKGAFTSYADKEKFDPYEIPRNTLYIIDGNITLKTLLFKKPLFLFGHFDMKGRVTNWFGRFSPVIKL
uniref:Polysaccharide deacetylase family protein n=1 Tax=candidate division WOR-3 bacterium TaxID=2052148 RepID=A0A7C3NEA9_UNCW3